MGKAVHTILAAVLLLLNSCSVKEDRQPCPSRLILDLSDFRELGGMVCTNVQDREHNFRDTLEPADGQMSLERAVKKGPVEVYAFSGMESSTERDGVVTIPAGCQADPLRGFLCRLDCREERVLIKAEPNRQTALIHLKIDDGGGGYPYKLQLKADVCGIDLKTMTPVEGNFRHNLELDGDLSCEFYLPRQKPDGRAVINVLCDSTLMEVFPLYSWINAAGYDWTLDDLPEIFLSINRAQLKVSVNVQGWEHEEYEIIL